MKLLTATALSLSLLTSALAQAQQPTQDAQSIKITRSGSQPARQGPAENFTGSVRVEAPFQASPPAHVGGATTIFEPGARTAWHAHPLGQTLIVTAGTGRVQRWGSPVAEIRHGDVVWIPPGQKHWHGAAPTTSMTHIAVVEQIDGKTTDWMEKVSDAQYGVVPSTRPAVNAAPEIKTMSKEPTPAQKAIGDFSPKMVELTDNVLFGDVWERPELSKRDRSLITVAALIANGNTEQLVGHLARAKENGVAETELTEVITHMAFYAGWPRAMSAITVAKKVFKPK